MTTIKLPPNPDKAAVLRAIDAQLRPTPAERAELEKARDGQEAIQAMLRLREDVRVG